MWVRFEKKSCTQVIFVQEMRRIVTYKAQHTDILRRKVESKRVQFEW